MRPSSSSAGENTSVDRAPVARADSVALTDDGLVVNLLDGRSLSMPVAWFPRLLAATPEQRANCRVTLRGLGLRWPELDEDLSVAGLLGLPD